MLYVIKVDLTKVDCPDTLTQSHRYVLTYINTVLILVVYDIRYSRIINIAILYKEGRREISMKICIALITLLRFVNFLNHIDSPYCCVVRCLYSNEYLNLGRF